MKKFQCSCSHCGSTQYSDHRPVTWICTMCNTSNKFNAKTSMIRCTPTSEELHVYLTLECNKLGIGYEDEHGAILINSIRKEHQVDLIIHKAKQLIHQPEPPLPQRFRKIKNGRAVICYVCPVKLTTFVTQDKVIEVLYLRFIKKLPFTPHMKIFNQSREMELFIRRYRISEKN